MSGPGAVPCVWGPPPSPDLLHKIHSEADASPLHKRHWLWSQDSDDRAGGSSIEQSLKLAAAGAPRTARAPAAHVR